MSDLQDEYGSSVCPCVYGLWVEEAAMIEKTKTITRKYRRTGCPLEVEHMMYSGTNIADCSTLRITCVAKYEEYNPAHQAKALQDMIDLLTEALHDITYA